MDIHDLKIFLMIAQEGSVSGNTYQEWLQKIRSGEITR